MRIATGRFGLLLLIFVTVALAGCGRTSTPNAVGFQLGVSDEKIIVPRGSDGTSATTITIARHRGFDGTVFLDVEGLPEGVTARFGTNPATAESVLTFHATPDAPLTRAVLRVRGVADPAEHAVELEVSVVDGLPANGASYGAPSALGSLQAPAHAGFGDFRESFDIPLPVSLTEFVELGRHQDYHAYYFEPGNPTKLRKTIWSGLLFLPDPRQASRPVPLTVQLYGNPFEDRWYRNEDGTLSKVIFDSRGGQAGVLTVTSENSASAAIDIDGDRIVDVLNAFDGERGELLIVSEARGAAFMNQWLMGLNPLCLPGVTTTPEEVGEAGISGCDMGGDADSGAAVGGSGGGGTRNDQGQDPLDKLCEGRTDRRPKGNVPGTVTDDNWAESLIGGAIWAGVVEFLSTPTNFRELPAEEVAARGAATARYLNAIGAFVTASSAAKAEASPCELLGPGACAAAAEENDNEAEDEPSDRGDSSGDEESGEDEEPAEGGGNTGEGDPSGSGESGEGGSSGGTGTSQPGVGPDGGPESDMEGELDELCARVAEARNNHIDSMDDLDRTAKDTDCDEPFVNPDPSAASTQEERNEDITCSTGSEQNNRVDMSELLEGGGNRSCGPTETPGPDGTCSGKGRSINTGQGTLWIGMGDIIGFTPCPDESCTPADVP